MNEFSDGDHRTRELDESDSSFDLSVSDLMAGLLMMFALLLSATLLNLQKEFEQKSDIAERYQDLQTALYEDLYEEFEDDLDDWGAEIDEDTLSVRFQEPDVLFDPDAKVVKPKFRQILRDFFPRYIAVLQMPAYEGHIEEVRIEGHSADPLGEYEGPQAFPQAIRFSQERTQNVLAFVMGLHAVRSDLDWIKERITANGLAHSRPILKSDGTPDWRRSRRVEFRVRTDAEEQIRELLEVARSEANTR